MNENAPPTGTGATPGTGDAARGMPYYEKLRRDLRETLQKKRALDQSLSELEDTIHKVESSYLEETTAGNIIKGFDNYIKGSSTTGGGGGAGGGPGTSSRRRGGITDADRIFSNSSVSFSKSLQDSPASTSAQTTPSHAPTPTPLSARDATNSNSNNTSNHPTPNETGSGLVKAGVTKKKKSTAAAVDKGDEEGDGRAAKRGKITYARE